jgi:hypothetical protein
VNENAGAGNAEAVEEDEVNDELLNENKAAPVEATVEGAAVEFAEGVVNKEAEVVLNNAGAEAVV